jgi:hypothetical protein
VHGKEELEILLIGWSDFLDGWTVRTRREQGSRRSIVGAHPSQRTRRMGHPQVQAANDAALRLTASVWAALKAVPCEVNAVCASIPQFLGPHPARIVVPSAEEKKRHANKQCGQPNNRHFVQQDFHAACGHEPSSPDRRNAEYQKVRKMPHPARHLSSHPRLHAKP